MLRACRQFESMKTNVVLFFFSLKLIHSPLIHSPLNIWCWHLFVHGLVLLLLAIKYSLLINPPISMCFYCFSTIKTCTVKLDIFMSLIFGEIGCLMADSRIFNCIHCCCTFFIYIVCIIDCLQVTWITIPYSYK